MTIRMLRGALALLAISALVAALAGVAAADKPVNPGKPTNPGSQGKGKGKSGIKYGVYKAKGGTTTLTIDSAFATFGGTPVTVSGVPLATVSGAPGAFDFPITKGRIVLKKGNKGHGKGAKPKKTLAGYVNHSGGLKFDQGATSVTFSNLRINLSAGKGGALDGNVNAGSDRVRLGRLSGVSVDPSNKHITATVTLSQAGADALNSGLALPPASMASKTTVLGTLKVMPTS